MRARALLTVVALLLIVTPASAGWIVYENKSGAWRGVSNVYNDLKACEADAKALAEKNQTWTGCAVPPAVRALTPAERAEQNRYMNAAKHNRAQDDARAAADAKAQAERLVEWEKESRADARAQQQADAIRDAANKKTTCYSRYARGGGIISDCN